MHAALFSLAVFLLTAADARRHRCVFASGALFLAIVVFGGHDYYSTNNNSLHRNPIDFNWCRSVYLILSIRQKKAEPHSNP